MTGCLWPAFFSGFEHCCCVAVFASVCWPARLGFSAFPLNDLNRQVRPPPGKLQQDASSTNAGQLPGAGSWLLSPHSIPDVKIFPWLGHCMGCSMSNLFCFGGMLQSSLLWASPFPVQKPACFQIPARLPLCLLEPCQTNHMTKNHGNFR